MPFTNVTSSSPAEIAEAAFDTTSLGPVATKEFFGRDEPDTKVFASRLASLVGATEGTDKVLVVWDRQASTLGWLVAYFSDRTVLVAALAPSEPATRWWKGIFDDYGRGELAVLTYHPPSQASASLYLEQHPRDDLQGFVENNVPASYTVDQEADKRNQLLDDFVVVDSMRQVVDVPTTQKLWTTLLDHTGTGRAGASDEDLDKAQRVMNVTFPDELVAFYQISNGADAAIFGHDVYSLDDMIKVWREWKSIFDGWTVEDLFGNTEPDGKLTLGMYTNPRWLPLVDMQQSAYLSFDLMPGPGGVLGQIIATGRDQDVIERVATDLPTLLHQASLEHDK